MTTHLDPIDLAVRTLRRGGLIAFPTETVYGLGADAENADAVARIFSVKRRPTNHPLIVHLAAASELPAWAGEVPECARLLAERFWPGPLTLVLRRGPRTPLAVTGGLETVALRVPGHALARELLEAFGGGIAAPSANRFGSVSPTSAQHVRDDLGAEVDYVLDGGPCAVGLESTIVDCSGAQPTLLRPGGVTREELERALGGPVPSAAAGGAVRAPGQHPSHYAPRAKVILVAAEELPERARRLREEGHRVGILVPPSAPRAEELRGLAEVVALAPAQSEHDFAQNLYVSFREFDRRGCDVVVATLPAEEGLGLAIADRLRRAAGERGEGKPHG